MTTQARYLLFVSTSFLLACGGDAKILTNVDGSVGTGDGSVSDASVGAGDGSASDDASTSGMMNRTTYETCTPAGSDCVSGTTCVSANDGGDTGYCSHDPTSVPASCDSCYVGPFSDTSDDSVNCYTHETEGSLCARPCDPSGDFSATGCPTGTTCREFDLRGHAPLFYTCYPE